MTKYVKVGNLQVASELYNFINQEALPGSGLETVKFWSGVETIFEGLTEKNKQLLVRRDELQNAINHWHKDNKDFDFEKYKLFLKEIGYLETEVEDFHITTENVDEEVALKAGPQLVVPSDNARYALNAANARWGSLYDALYGTDVISEEDGAQNAGSYNPIRGEKVISFAKDFLDQSAALKQSSHKEVINYTIVDGNLAVSLS